MASDKETEEGPQEVKPAPRPLVCQADDCGKDLAGDKTYYQRHRVCATHLRQLSVLIQGVPCRFCQQCAKFQALDEFDGTKRSCRTRLTQHNARRRMKTEDVPVETSGEAQKALQAGGPDSPSAQLALLRFSGSASDKAPSPRRPPRAAATAAVATLAAVAALDRSNASPGPERRRRANGNASNLSRSSSNLTINNDDPYEMLQPGYAAKRAGSEAAHLDGSTQNSPLALRGASGSRLFATAGNAHPADAHQLHTPQPARGAWAAGGQLRSSLAYASAPEQSLHADMSGRVSPGAGAGPAFERALSAPEVIALHDRGNFHPGLEPHQRVPSAHGHLRLPPLLTLLQHSQLSRKRQGGPGSSCATPTGLSDPSYSGPNSFNSLGPQHVGASDDVQSMLGAHATHSLSSAGDTPYAQRASPRGPHMPSRLEQCIVGTVGCGEALVASGGVSPKSVGSSYSGQLQSSYSGQLARQLQGMELLGSQVGDGSGHGQQMMSGLQMPPATRQVTTPPQQPPVFVNPPSWWAQGNQDLTAGLARAEEPEDRPAVRQRSTEDGQAHVTAARRSPEPTMVPVPPSTTAVAAPAQVAPDAAQWVAQQAYNATTAPVAFARPTQPQRPASWNPPTQQLPQPLLEQAGARARLSEVGCPAGWGTHTDAVQATLDQLTSTYNTTTDLNHPTNPTTAMLQDAAADDKGINLQQLINIPMPSSNDSLGMEGLGSRFPTLSGGLMALPEESRGPASSERMLAPLGGPGSAFTFAPNGTELQAGLGQSSQVMGTVQTQGYAPQTQQAPWSMEFSPMVGGATGVRPSLGATMHSPTAMPQQQLQQQQQQQVKQYITVPPPTPNTVWRAQQAQHAPPGAPVYMRPAAAPQASADGAAPVVSRGHLHLGAWVRTAAPTAAPAPPQARLHFAQQQQQQQPASTGLAPVAPQAGPHFVQLQPLQQQPASVGLTPATPATERPPSLSQLVWPNDVRLVTEAEQGGLDMTWMQDNGPAPL